MRKMRLFCVVLCLSIFSCLPDETSSVHPHEGGCVCPVIHRHPQDYFCIAAFVMKAKIKKIKQDGNFRKYKIKRLQLYRTRERWNLVPPNKRKFIYTSMSISSCGLPDLEKKKTYLFAGQVHVNNILFIRQCDWVEKWSKLTKKQKEYIENPFGYRTACGCSVAYSSCDKCTDCFSAAVCAAQNFPTLAKTRCAEKAWLPWEKECYEKYSHCRWCPGCQRCQWVTEFNADYQACLNRFSFTPGRK